MSVRIIDTRPPGRDAPPRHRPLPVDMAGPAGKRSRKGGTTEHVVMDIPLTYTALEYTLRISLRM